MQNVNMYLSGYQDKICQNMYIAKGQCPFFSKLFAIRLRSAFLKKKHSLRLTYTACI